MQEPLYRLAYCSCNAIHGSPAEVGEQIRQILEVSRRKNLASNLTGALMFASGSFAQVLEGPRDAVERIFESIECDARHRDVTVLHFVPVERRVFPRWTMAFAGAADDRLAAMALDAALAQPAEAASEALLALLTGLIGREHDWAPQPITPGPIAR